MLTPTAENPVAGEQPRHASDSALSKLDPREEHFVIPGPREGMSLFLRRLAPSLPTVSRIVLYVHGATFPSALSIAHRFSGRSWRDALCEAGFDVWGLDFYGFGHSSRYPEMDALPEKHAPLCAAADATRQLEAAVRFILSHRGENTLSIISHSWGSMPVGCFATAHPTLLDRWVLFAPIARRAPLRYGSVPTFPAWRLISGEDQWHRFVEDVPVNERPVLSQREFDEWVMAYLDTDAQSRTRTPPSVKTPSGPFSEIIAAWHGSLPYEPSRVQAPLAIIRGEWDGLLPDADARWLFDACSRSPNKRDIKIARGTHLMHLETMRWALWQESISFLSGNDVAPIPTTWAGEDHVFRNI
jgi:pimeloyl-ACP methyl ester carboxylesterase